MRCSFPFPRCTPQAGCARERASVRLDGPQPQSGRRGYPALDTEFGVQRLSGAATSANGNSAVSRASFGRGVEDGCLEDPAASSSSCRPVIQRRCRFQTGHPENGGTEDAPPCRDQESEWFAVDRHQLQVVEDGSRGQLVHGTPSTHRCSVGLSFICNTYSTRRRSYEFRKEIVGTAARRRRRIATEIKDSLREPSTSCPSSTVRSSPGSPSRTVTSTAWGSSPARARSAPLHWPGVPVCTRPPSPGFSIGWKAAAGSSANGTLPTDRGRLRVRPGPHPALISIFSGMNRSMDDSAPATPRRSSGSSPTSSKRTDRGGVVRHRRTGGRLSQSGNTNVVTATSPP